MWVLSLVYWDCPWHWSGCLGIVYRDCPWHWCGCLVLCIETVHDIDVGAQSCVLRLSMALKWVFGYCVSRLSMAGPLIAVLSFQIENIFGLAVHERFLYTASHTDKSITRIHRYNHTYNWKVVEPNQTEPHSLKVVHRQRQPTGGWQFRQGSLIAATSSWPGGQWSTGRDGATGSISE